MEIAPYEIRCHQVLDVDEYSLRSFLSVTYRQIAQINQGSK